MKLTTEYHDPRDLAIALLSDSDPDMLFLSDVIEWVDHLGSNPEFTLRGLDYFIISILNNRTIKTKNTDPDLYLRLLDNIARLSAKVSEERAHKEEDNPITVAGKE